MSLNEFSFLYTLVIFLLLNLIKVLQKQACLDANKKDIKHVGMAFQKQIERNTLVLRK
jgi:hypothetical protein